MTGDGSPERGNIERLVEVLGGLGIVVMISLTSMKKLDICWRRQ